LLISEFVLILNISLSVEDELIYQRTGSYMYRTTKDRENKRKERFEDPVTQYNRVFG
jgi:hypothetical protein